jgi:hemoglobin-like flavoprotein
MLSDQNRPVIEATLPVVGEHIGKIAERFYGHMFTEHPELLDGTFNRGNQASGEQQQALAGSVAAFASSLIQTPERVPENLLSRIAHKHASLGIRPDQYQVVHDNLMWAIVDVLGDAVTAEVAAAWDEVYWLMGNALINQERGLYSARGVRPETVWRDWQVERKIRETADVVTFVVKRIDDRLVKTSLPGQYVTVRMRMPDGVRQPRQYSLTRATTANIASSRSNASTAAASPTERCQRSCMTPSKGATSSPCRCPTARLCSTTPGAPPCSPVQAWASPRWPECSPTSSRPEAISPSPCCTPTSTRAPSPCAAKSSATSSRCATLPSTSGTRTAHRPTNRSTDATAA